MLKSLFNKVTGLQVCNFTRKRLQHWCFPMNIANFKNTYFEKQRLLLIVVIHCIENWMKLFRNQIGLLFSLKHKITLFYLLSFVFICFITRCHVIRCHSLSFFCYSLSFVVTCCHSLLFVITWCVTRCTTRCHSLYLSLSLVVIQCHSIYHSSVFYKRSWDICKKIVLKQVILVSKRTLR